MAESVFLYLQRVAGLGVCPKCQALPNEPCTSTGYARGEFRKRFMSWPHSGRHAIGNRRGR